MVYSNVSPSTGHPVMLCLVVRNDMTACVSRHCCLGMMFGQSRVPLKRRSELQAIVFRDCARRFRRGRLARSSYVSRRKHTQVLVPKTLLSGAFEAAFHPHVHCSAKVVTKG